MSAAKKTMRPRSARGPSPAPSAARVASSRPAGRRAACARISARSAPASKRRSATSNFPAWIENLICLKFAEISLSLGTYAPT